MANIIRCLGEVVTISGYPQCSGQWEVVEQLPPFDLSQLDPVLLSSAFGAGFTLVGTFVVLSITIKAVLHSIKNH